MPQEEVEAHVVEWTEAKEVKRAEIHSLVVANRALEADVEKLPAPSLWESYLKS